MATQFGTPNWTPWLFDCFLWPAPFLSWLPALVGVAILIEQLLF